MTPALWPPSLPEVAFFRDSRGAIFAAEVVRAPEWSPFLAEPLDPMVADIRIALVDRCERRIGVPEWVAMLPGDATEEPAEVVQAALDAWMSAPSHRTVVAPPEDYVIAGFQALCPPHPPCEPGLRARDSLMEYLAERPGFLGRLGKEGRDGFNRLVQLTWGSPDDFAAEILRERIRDAGAPEVVDLVAFVEAAEIADEGTLFGELAAERETLLMRLRPLRYFTDARDFDRAIEATLAWADRYRRAYAAHYREVVAVASETLAEVASAVVSARMLASINLTARPVGDDAIRRLNAAVEELRNLPKAPLPNVARTGEVILGRMPRACTEARLAAAAVHAAVDVQRRRAATAPIAR